MKRFFLGAIAALCSSALFATTLSPVQLLNPVGSTAGQALISSGPTTPPAWGSIGFANLPQAAANTVLGNGTASTAAVTALAVPSCSASGNALKWTAASGFSCGTGNALTANPLSQFAATTSAQLLGVISDETGTGLAVFGTSPTLNQPNIVGITSGASAAAGSVGELLTASSTATAVTNGVTSAPISEALTAGIWDVQVVATITPAGTTVVQTAIVGVSTASNAFNNLGTYVQTPTVNTTAGALQTIASPTVRVTISTPTTYFGAVNVSFITSTCTATVKINARRVN